MQLLEDGGFIMQDFKKKLMEMLLERLGSDRYSIKEMEMVKNNDLKAIRIIAPAPFKKKEEQQVRDEHGNFKTEKVEVTIPAFKAVPVFDVSDTYGDPLPTIGAEAELVGEYSFGYIAGWSSGKELTELKSSMETIQKTADKIISGIEEKMHEYRKERLPEQSQTQENVDELYQKMDVKNADSYTKVSEAAVAYEVTSEGYNWPGMQKLSMAELEQYAKEPEGFIGLYMLYPDCTEAQIIEPMTMDEIKDALSRGIEFGDELPKRIEAVNDTGYCLTYTDPYSGEPMEVTLELSSYLNNGQIYLGLVQMDEVYGPEPYGEITVNLGWPCPFYCSYIDTNNFSNVEDFIVSNGLGVFTGLTQKSGFCEYPLYQFFPEKLRELEPRELAQYERINKIPAEHQKSNETLQEQEHEHQHELEQKKKR